MAAKDHKRLPRRDRSRAVGIGGIVMAEDINFATFIARIRAGDDQAARELVARYEPVIRREVRMRLRDPRLLSRFDWTDISQAVMASFFVRAASGQYDLEQPDQLLRLLVVMTRHKLSKEERRHRAERRDYRRLEHRDPAFLNGQSQESPSPSRVLAGRELLEALRIRLSADDRRLADLRAQGCEWAEISARLGGTPQARRKQLARAIDRALNHIEKSEADHG
jgi:RNA polymerase sigma factor (sigma-70 family)